MLEGYSNANASTDNSIGLVLPPSAREPGLQALAETLVAQARAEGVNLTGPDGLVTGLIRRVLEVGLEVEMAEHLGFERGDPAGAGAANIRNGHTENATAISCRLPRAKPLPQEPDRWIEAKRGVEDFGGSNVCS